MRDLNLRLSRLTDSLFSVTARLRRPDVITFAGPIDSVTAHPMSTSHFSAAVPSRTPLITGEIQWRVGYSGAVATESVKATYTHWPHTQWLAVVFLTLSLFHFHRRTSILATSVTISFTTVVLRVVFMLSVC